MNFYTTLRVLLTLGFIGIIIVAIMNLPDEPQKQNAVPVAPTNQVSQSKFNL